MRLPITNQIFFRHINVSSSFLSMNIFFLQSADLSVTSFQSSAFLFLILCLGAQQNSYPSSLSFL